MVTLLGSLTPTAARRESCEEGADEGGAAGVEDGTTGQSTCVVGAGAAVVAEAAAAAVVPVEAVEAAAAEAVETAPRRIQCRRRRRCTASLT